MPSFSERFFAESAAVLSAVDPDAVEQCALGLAEVRDQGGRLFILGVGGSAGHASHAVNDFRKLCGFEAYTPTDNVSELTARINDDGWDSALASWLAGSRLGPLDGLLVFSVGGGDAAKGVSVNLIRALDLAIDRGTAIYGIVGRDGGYTAKVARRCVIIPPLYADHVTPHTEGLCAVVWHLLVSHPRLARSNKVGVDLPLSTIEADLSRVCVVGGAGFIGSHFTDRLLADKQTERVVIFDNFSSGRAWHLEHHQGDRRLEVIHGEVEDLDSLTQAISGCPTVIHLASNPDIARAATEPAIDFDQGTRLTHHVVEAMRRSGSRTILYASGSGVYGDLGDLEVDEDYGPLIPISTYGASKLAGEALIASYCHMFDLTGCAFRFGNVVGPRQTHGVGFDFIRNLLVDPHQLRILGDGTQSKSYIHVSDVVDAVLLAAVEALRPFSVFNVATGDYITVRDIAEMAVEIVGSESTTFDFTGGDRGWRGDVPVIRLQTERIRKLGWSNQLSTREALSISMESMLSDARLGKLG